MLCVLPMFNGGVLLACNDADRIQMLQTESREFKHQGLLEVIGEAGFVMGERGGPNGPYLLPLLTQHLFKICSNF